MINKHNLSSDSFFEVQNLVKNFEIRKGVFQKLSGKVHAVDDVSFKIERGKTLGLVGESGCGKTTTARIILQLEKANSGRIFLEGKENSSDKKSLNSYRKDVQMVFQDPYSSLNPRKSVAQLIGEPLKIHGLYKGDMLKEKIIEILNLVNLSPNIVNRYPHEFSGGQRQRIGIARALTLNPKLIVCDEPVSALDVSIRSQIINLFTELQNKNKLAYLFISHDLSLIEYISDSVAVMYLGKIVEIAPTSTFFSDSRHPYSEALLSAIPSVSPNKRSNRIILSGDAPSPINPPSGCRFRTRCPIAQPICTEIEPVLSKISDSHWVSCHFRTS